MPDDQNRRELTPEEKEIAQRMINLRNKLRELEKLEKDKILLVLKLYISTIFSIVTMILSSLVAPYSCVWPLSLIPVLMFAFLYCKVNQEIKKKSEDLDF